MTMGTRLIASLAVWMALGTGAGGPLLAQVMLRGRVLDDVSGQPLPGARVLLLNRYNRVVDYQVTDDDGSFRFKPRSGNRLRMEAKAISYRPTITPPLWMVSDRDSAAVEIRLAPHAVLLAPVEIVALSAPTTSAILENVVHRGTRGFGLQITRQDIEQRQPQRVSDILLEVPGVYAARSGSGPSDRSLYMGRALGACPVQVFLDGMRATRDNAAGDVRVDDLVNPLDIEVIEVFRGLGSIPPEFLTSYARCGVIAIWTRRSLEWKP